MDSVLCGARRVFLSVLTDRPNNQPTERPATTTHKKKKHSVRPQGPPQNGRGSLARVALCVDVAIETTDQWTKLANMLNGEGGWGRIPGEREHARGMCMKSMDMDGKTKTCNSSAFVMKNTETMPNN